MVDTGLPLFSAVASSSRQLFFLLRCIGFANKVDVRVTSDGLRFSVHETGVLEAFVFLSKTLFASYRLQAAPANGAPSSSPAHSQVFTLPLQAFLSTLQILSSASEPNGPTGNPSSRITGPYSSDPYSASFAAHRLTRYSAFSSSVLGTQGQCRITYRAEGARLELSVPETGGIRTVSSLATYVTSESRWEGGDSDEEGDGTTGEAESIPFDREDLRLKAILPSTVIGDTIVEIGALGTPEVLVVEGSSTAPYLVFRGEGGSGGECRVEFGDEAVGQGRTKLLETFLCQGRIRARYGFATVRKALVAMRAGTKVSVRIDGRGVLSLQFLIEVGEGEGDKASEQVAFVDFRIVPLYEQAEGGDTGSDDD